MSFRIETILIKDIAEYASSDVWKNARIIPITRERALSQQKNPHAKPGDPCLWVALSDQDDEVIGFCGSLPGQDVRNKVRMGWNSCWWVDSDRGREAAMPLFYHFLQAWDHRVAFSDMTSQTLAIVDLLGFCNTREEKLVQIYLRIPVSKIISSLGVPGKLLFPLILPVAILVNGIQQIRIGLIGRTKKGLNVESRDRLDDELYGFIRQYQESNFTSYSMEEFRWIEQNPWLVPGDRANRDTGGKYPFSYRVKEYFQKWLVTSRNKEITSVSLISVRDGSLKVLYLFAKNPSDAICAIKTIISSAFRIHSLIYAHPDLISRYKEIRPVVLYMLNRKRYSGVSKKILTELPDKLVIQMGDGDAVFT